MKLNLTRKWFTEKSTIGELFIDGQRECFTLEDCVHDGPKVPGKTAIPEGNYQVIITHSKRFNRDLPLLVDVPGFEGIRIHPGNTAANTEGCILVGESRGTDSIGLSRFAFNKLFSRLQAAANAHEQITIEIASENGHETELV